MKKHLHFVVCLCFLLGIQYSSHAQLADNTIAPDFTLTDIDGNEHNLYNYLDAGKSVILNFSTTWNSDCWNYHSSNVLQDLYTEYGPTASDELMVLFMESDIITGEADLNGATSTSQGDYVSTANFPLINIPPPPTLVGTYAVTEFPTIYLVQPNRLIKNVGQVGATVFADLIDNAPPAAFGENNVAILAYQSNQIYCEGVSVAVQFQNLGSETVNSATFMAKVGTQTIGTTEWTGNLAPFELANVSFPTLNTDDLDLEITFEVNTVNGVADEDMTENTQRLQIKRFETDTQTLTINVETDDYGYETYWALLDETESIVAEGGNINVGLTGAGLQQQPNGGYDNNTENSQTVNIAENACYKFVIIDDWGDGICCTAGNGDYSITDDSGNIIFEGGAFEAIETLNIENKETIVVSNIVANFDYTAIAENEYNFTNQTTGDNIVGYLWDFGDGSTSTEESPTHTFDLNGETEANFTVVLTVNDSNETASTHTEIINITMTNTAVFSVEQSILVYPIPASNVLTIEIDNAQTINQVQLFNALGQSVLNRSVKNTENVFTINTNSLANGVYYLQLSDTKTTFSKKIEIIR